MIDMSSEFCTLLDGPLYERCAKAALELLPLLPSDEDMHAGFRAHLRRLVDGVEVVGDAAGEFIQIERQGRQEIYRRTHVYARMLIWGETMASMARVDAVRSAAFAVSEKMAGRIAEQVQAFRATIGVNEPIVLHFVGRLPMLIGSNMEAPLVFYDHHSDRVGAIYAAYYCVTPVSERNAER